MHFDIIVFQPKSGAGHQKLGDWRRALGARKNLGTRREEISKRKGKANGFTGD